MNTIELDSIFEQIRKLDTLDSEEKKKKPDIPKNSLQEILCVVSEEIQRVLDENGFTQEDLCSITRMSQSNLSKIQNGRVVPRIETLQKIAQATHTKLIISFENMEGDEQ